MRLVFVCVLLALSFPGIISKLEDNTTKCGDLFFNGKAPVISGILEDSVTQTEDYKIICQIFKNKIRFATVYDTKEKIPVFSAYKYTGTNMSETPQHPWMIELQLEPSGAEMSTPFVKQARYEVYTRSNSYNCSPGPLFPASHAADRETANSTFTLTNSVPLREGFRERLWYLVEKITKENMDSYCRDENNNIAAYVLTGVIPGNKTLNNRVNIPSHMWTAFCCYNSANRSLVSQAYSAENRRYNNSFNSLVDLEEIQNFLKDTWVRNAVLFDNNCLLI